MGESVFTLPVNVRYMEVDPQRVVLNAWYLTDFDEVMTAVLKARGLLYQTMLDNVSVVHDLDAAGGSQRIVRFLSQ